GRTPRWDPTTFPTTWAQARPMMREHPAFIATAEEFEGALQGRWPRVVPRRLRPYLLTRLWRLIRPDRAEGEPTPGRGADPDRDRLITDIRRFLDEKGLPALVVHIPDRPSLLDPERGSGWAIEDARDFARALGAEFLDGTEAFAGLGPGEIRALFLPFDGHWNQ